MMRTDQEMGQRYRMMRADQEIKAWQGSPNQLEGISPKCLGGDSLCWVSRTASQLRQ